jgi:EAL domain-containing protein (putative c-di-GMP-specific phosphodiesterase class I)/GGDEF domain-containing protein
MPSGSRQFSYSLLLREIENLRVEAGVTGIALVLLRLKGLGEVNKTLGYIGGDRVLEIIASRMGGVGRQQDRLVPLSKSLFALLIRSPLHEGHAVLGAEKAVRVVSEPVVLGHDRLRLRAIAGISLLPALATTAEELLRQSELAINEAELRDEPCVVYTPALSAPESAEQEAWADIDDALRQGEFEIHYQPKVDLRTGILTGAEALARWRHPTKGLISPDKFIPVIEGTDSVRTLLWYVLNTALRQAAAWNKCWPGFKIAVNVSPTSLAEADLVELLAGAIQIWNVPAKQLVLEITESALMGSPLEAAHRLYQLRELGVHVSIDDFGTGYSSLAYLKNLPANELKIDKSFILPITNSETDRRLVESIIQLGHAVGLEVVAEGIEDEATLRVLADMDCDIGQGYHLGRPVDAAAFEARWFQVDAASAALRSA